MYQFKCNHWVVLNFLNILNIKTPYWVFVFNVVMSDTNSVLFYGLFICLYRLPTIRLWCWPTFLYYVLIAFSNEFERAVTHIWMSNQKLSHICWPGYLSFLFKELCHCVRMSGISMPEVVFKEGHKFRWKEPHFGGELQALFSNKGKIFCEIWL